MTKKRSNAESGKREYVPRDPEAKEKYSEFMASLGVDIEVQPFSVPRPISKDDYPEPIITCDDDFDSFVAFDFETTGFSPATETIIEIGAIKVLNGQIIEEKEFTFQKFVRPYHSRVTPQITEVTGITPDNVQNARQMWDVTTDFLNFVGNLSLVGYNNAHFDSKFLVRAGRYSHIVVTNPHFDVMLYAKKKIRKFGLRTNNCKLSTLAEYLGVPNPQAHRALADAITTAKVFLKLKSMN